MSDETTTPAERPAAPGSLLGQLRARREAIEAKLHLDLAVPRMENPEVLVRFRPVTSAEITRVADQHRKNKAKDVDVIINAVHLAAACEGIFYLHEGQPVGINGKTDPDEWPRFDQEVAESLGLPDGSKAVDVVRGLYFTDGDIISTGAELLVWSGYARQDLERDAEGN